MTARMIAINKQNSPEPHQGAFIACERGTTRFTKMASQAKNP
jgi:hypothetical protein